MGMRTGRLLEVCCVGSGCRVPMCCEHCNPNANHSCLQDMRDLLAVWPSVLQRLSWCQAPGTTQCGYGMCLSTRGRPRPSLTPAVVRQRNCQTCTTIDVFSFLLVLTLAFRPDGLELAVATLDGQILFWDVNRWVEHEVGGA